MNIIDFEKWSGAVNEGIDTNISSDDNDSKDEITIDDTTYTIRKNKISTNNVEISDNKLKTDIRNANRAIGDLKETEERFEELRLTGGEDTTIAEEVIDIINDNEYTEQKPDISLFDEIKSKCSDFFEISGKIAYISIPNLENLFKPEIANKIKYIFSRHETGIGKGEYFLPLLFKDVHKKRPFGTDPYTKKRVKGDNYITNDNNIYDLEVKSPNAPLNFNSYGEAYIKKHLKDEEKNDIYQKAITSRFLKYAQSQAKSFDGNLYMCIFDEKNPSEDILFINLSNIQDGDIVINSDSNTELFKTIYDLIYIDNIDTYTEGKKGKKNDIAYSFTFTYDSENKKLKCILKSKIVQESLILSRDNFVNEYLTK